MRGNNEKEATQETYHEERRKKEKDFCFATDTRTQEDDAIKASLTS
jgi:hypothetical protein